MNIYPIFVIVAKNKYFQYQLGYEKQIYLIFVFIQLPIHKYIQCLFLVISFSKYIPGQDAAETPHVYA